MLRKMPNRKNKRISFLILASLIIIGFAALIIKNFQENIVFFYDVSDIDYELHKERKIRIGGLVKDNSVKYNNDASLEFILTDNIADIVIIYYGIEPDLFRAGQGIVAEGYLSSTSLFKADILLAKHDETYKPPAEEE